MCQKQWEGLPNNTTQLNFWNDVFQITTIFHNTQQYVLKHDNRFQNISLFQNLTTGLFQNTIFWFTTTNYNTTKFHETLHNFKVLTLMQRAIGNWDYYRSPSHFPLIWPVHHVLPQLRWGEKVTFISSARSVGLVYCHLRLVKCLLLRSFKAKSRKKTKPYSSSSPSPSRWTNLWLLQSGLILQRAAFSSQWGASRFPQKPTNMPQPRKY